MVLVSSCRSCILLLWPYLAFASIEFSFFCASNLPFQVLRVVVVAAAAVVVVVVV